MRRRIVDVREMRPGRVRPEAVDKTAREPVTASLGERAIAKQVARKGSRRVDGRQDSA
jgi:hypothetical protein